MNNIYLCGFMGCGKSTVGRQLARQLGRSFVDLDKYIVRTQGMPIPALFEQFGEPHFRTLETEALRTVGQDAPTVIATGGGAFMRAENVACARENGVILFLNPPFSVCYARIKGDKNRPLVVQNTREQLYTLYKTRQAVYRAACDMEINEVLSPFRLARRIAKQLQSGQKEWRG